MKFGSIYQSIIEEGRRNDPLNIKSSVYHDTACLCGKENKNIKIILVGIDIGVGEVLLADRLRQLHIKIDMILAHHPLGRALSNYHRAMIMQAELLQYIGVQKKEAEKYLFKDIEKMQRCAYSENIDSVIDVCKILKIPIMCAHTPVDNLAYCFLNKYLKRAKKLDDVVNLLSSLPEYRYQAKSGLSPQIIKGQPSALVGRFWVDTTGGNPLPAESLAKIYKCGIKTIIAAHLTEKTNEVIKKLPLNYILTGHMANDSLGLNLLLRRLQKNCSFKIIPCGGYIYIP